MSFERLMREHDELERRNTLLRAVARGAPAPDEAFALLMDFATGIAEHRAQEQRLVYEPLLHLADSGDLRDQSGLRNLVTQMEADWTDYLYDWNAECIAADWTTFSELTETILGRAAERLRLENDVIYPLALKHGTIALRERSL